MTIVDRLESKYCLETLSDISEIPSNQFLVYILTIDGRPVVVGHGRTNRARVIFDSELAITNGHIKAILVRVFTLFSRGSVFSRGIIRCSDKQQAREIEARIHREFGGNSCAVPDNIRLELFFGLEQDAVASMVLNMALCSSFDGIADLKKWRRAGILNDDVWNQVASRLKL